MSEQNRMDRIDLGLLSCGSPSEPESHIEHQAALDATLFRTARASNELVFELEAGELRIRWPQGS
jgi:hypothetical protein